MIAVSSLLALVRWVLSWLHSIFYTSSVCASNIAVVTLEILSCHIDDLRRARTQLSPRVSCGIHIAAVEMIELAEEESKNVAVES